MRNRRRPGRGIHVLAAVVFAGGTLYVGAKGVGPLPPIGAALNPGTGVWTTALDAVLPADKSLTIAGLLKPVQVYFDQSGVASIQAQNDHDLFLTMGYLHAKFRLFQMDLMRRQGEGLLSEIVGAKALPSDTFEDQLGLMRTAQQEWNSMPPSDPARLTLTAYAQGVNDVIQKETSGGQLPMMFKLLGYRPAAWTPIDSLVIQGDMTQTLDFTTAPLDYALLVKSLGIQRTMSWFPVLPVDTQHPYDPGPYHSDPPAPVTNSATISNGEAKAVLALTEAMRSLPATAIHHGSNSNNWAVDGTKTASGKPMLAGDPHLDQTLPAIWYQLAANSPDEHFSGVSIPGLPGILIGHNDHIAWSLTNVQNQATFFYQEKTDASHPNEYYWNGAWQPMQQVHYTIPVKGQAPTQLTVNLTVHGPIMTQKGQTLSVDWIGASPSPDIDAILQLSRAANFTDFKNALRNWRAPSQNFIYADDQGNIGLISAGEYPIVHSGTPWLPLPGTGQADIIGQIPFADIPQVYNPRTHIVFSANQRVVSGNYPYYIGTSLDFFDNGYRADEIQQVLTQGSKLTPTDFERLQNNTQDYLASLIVPKLLPTLSTASLTPQEKAAETALQNWNDDMGADSQGAAIWWTFWSQYLKDTFGPWWKSAKVPDGADGDIKIDPSLVPLNEDLEAWTLHDPLNPAFSLPDGTHRTAAQVMLQAFHDATTQLTHSLGANVAQWQWGRLHFRAFDSLSQVASLGYGPRSSGGDMWTIDAADGGAISTAGPSWRMIVDFGGTSEGVYPGGQSENPVSPWYENKVSMWWDGQYAPMPSSDVAQGPASEGGQIQWTLDPTS